MSHVTTITFGRGDLRARLYSKRSELNSPRGSHDRAGGADTEQAWHFEFQIRFAPRGHFDVEHACGDATPVVSESKSSADQK